MFDALFIMFLFKMIYSIDYEKEFECAMGIYLSCSFQNTQALELLSSLSSELCGKTCKFKNYDTTIELTTIDPKMAKYHFTRRD